MYSQVHPASPPFGFPAFACASEMLDVVRSSSAPTSMTCCSRIHNRRHWGELKDTVNGDVNMVVEAVNVSVSMEAPGYSVVTASSSSLLHMSPVNISLH